MERKTQLTRRKLLKDAAHVGLAGTLTPLNSIVQTKFARKNLIAAENEKEGTTDWQLTYIKSELHRSKLIEGYCSKMSVLAGETLDIFLNVEAATEVTIDIFRMGYYGGKGARFVKRLDALHVEPQPTPPIAEHRLRACNWERTTTLTIPMDWLSGVYLGKLRCKAHRYESYIVFVVRDDRKADILFQTSDTTWQAYNKWPDEYSLYDSDPPKQPHSTRTWVSYDRPFGKYPQVVDQPLSQGSGEFLLWEYPLCFWLEQQGYDVTYRSNIDTHADPKALDLIKCFLSVGHDEYWTLGMYENVKKAVDNGLNVAFLSGNSVKWVIELKSGVKKANKFDGEAGLALDGSRLSIEPDVESRPFRIIARKGRFGGLSKEEKARKNYAGPFAMAGPNEGLLIGARNPSPPNGSADWIVSNPDHWVFEGTGMKKGDRIPGLVGWEHHGDPAAIPGLEVVAEGTTINSGGAESHYTATVYPGPKGNWVFNAATIFWSMGLAQPPGLVPPHSHFGRPHGVDERVQRITANFLKRCNI